MKHARAFVAGGRPLVVEGFELHPWFNIEDRSKAKEIVCAGFD